MIVDDKERIIQTILTIIMVIGAVALIIGIILLAKPNKDNTNNNYDTSEKPYAKVILKEGYEQFIVFSCENSELVIENNSIICRGLK